MAALTRQPQLLNVEVTLGRPVVLAKNRTAVQVLADIRPVADNPTAPQADWRFVIDCSGSMSDAASHDLQISKLELVRKAIANVAKSFNPEDRAMLVAFDSKHDVAFPHAVMSDENRNGFIRAAASLIAGGNTRFSEALEAALAPPVEPGSIPRIIFLTDGENNVHSGQDTRRVFELAAKSWDSEIAWCNYATGIEYNVEFMKRLPHLCPAGSFRQHVTNVASLESHLAGELAFLRGVAVERLDVEGQVHGGELHSVTRFMPAQHSVEHETGEFKDGSGAVDRFRGQQYLIEMIIPNPRPGLAHVLTLAISGKEISSSRRFRQELPVEVQFTDNPRSESKPSRKVVDVQRMVVAAKMAEQGKYDKSADMYARAGDHSTARHMRTLHHTSTRGTAYDRANAERDTTVYGSVTERFTIVDDDSTNGSSR